MEADDAAMDADDAEALVVVLTASLGRVEFRSSFGMMRNAVVVADVGAAVVIVVFVVVIVCDCEFLSVEDGSRSVDFEVSSSRDVDIVIDAMVAGSCAPISFHLEKSIPGGMRICFLFCFILFFLFVFLTTLLR